MPQQPERRMRDLNAIVGEHFPSAEPPEVRMAVAMCNGCGLVLQIVAPPECDIAKVAALAMTGWGKGLEGGPDDDLCPSCV
jgi:hypothetical protein